MTPHPKYNGTLWAALLGAALAVWVILQFMACGPGAGPTSTMAKVVRAAVEAQCSDLMPVVECLDAIDKNAAAVDALLPDGGR